MAGHPPLRFAPSMTREQMADLMGRRSMTPKQLADLTARSERTIMSYLYGERRVPDDIASILRALEQNGGTPWWEETAKRMAQAMTTDLYRERKALRQAVLAMCRSCEPDGVCMQADCPLRPVSPLPLTQGKQGGTGRWLGVAATTSSGGTGRSAPSATTSEQAA